MKQYSEDTSLININVECSGMIKKLPEMSSGNNSKEMVTPFFKEIQSTEQRPSEVYQPPLIETSDGSVIETRCLPYPIELNHNRND